MPEQILSSDDYFCDQRVAEITPDSLSEQDPLFLIELSEANEISDNDTVADVINTYYYAEEIKM